MMAIALLLNWIKQKYIYNFTIRKFDNIYTVLLFIIWDAVIQVKFNCASKRYFE